MPSVGIAIVDEQNNLINLKPSKETTSRLVIHGRMLLNKKIFGIKDKLTRHENNEYYLPYALLQFNDIYAYKYNGNYFNIGERCGFIKASIYYALKDKNKDLKEYINNIKENLNG